MTRGFWANRWHGSTPRCGNPRCYGILKSLDKWEQDIDLATVCGRCGDINRLDTSEATRRPPVTAGIHIENP